MIAYTTAWIRFAILELLARNPEGADGAQIVKALKPFDEGNRAGRVFQTLRESRDIVEAAERGLYQLSEQGRQALNNCQAMTMTLPKHVTLPPREVIAAKEATPAPPSAYRPEQVASSHGWNAMLRPNERPKPDTRKSSVVGQLRMNILQVVRAAPQALSPADIFAELRDDTPRATVNYHLKCLVANGSLLAAGNTTQRRYTTPERAHLLEDLEPAVPKTNPQGPGNSPQAKAERARIVSILTEAGRALTFSEIREAMEWRKHVKHLRMQIRRLVNGGEIAAAGNTARRRYAALEHAEQLASAPGAALEPVSTIPEQDKPPAPKSPDVQLIVFAIDNAMASLKFLKETLLEEAQ